MDKFSVRRGDLEVHSCDKMLLQDGEHTKAEIVQWTPAGTSYYTLAAWRDNGSGFELHFINDRPLKVNPKRFMGLVKIGYSILKQNYVFSGRE